RNLTAPRQRDKRRLGLAVEGGELIKRLAATAILLICTLAVRVPSAAASTTCRVKNVGTGATYLGGGQDLQAAINRAGSGSLLRITGLCLGRFEISKRLTLLGKASKAFPVATLDAD